MISFIELDQIDDLELIEESSGGHTLIAKWIHHTKQKLCGKEYLVTFGDGVRNQTKTTNRTSINFDISYCTTVFTIVQAVSGGVISKGKLARYKTGKAIINSCAENYVG